MSPGGRVSRVPVSPLAAGRFDPGSGGFTDCLLHNVRAMCTLLGGEVVGRGSAVRPRDVARKRRDP
jgi:hypothetical protein